MATKTKKSKAGERHFVVHPRAATHGHDVQFYDQEPRGIYDDGPTPYGGDSPMRAVDAKGETIDPSSVHCLGDVQRALGVPKLAAGLYKVAAKKLALKVKKTPKPRVRKARTTDTADAGADSAAINSIG